MDGSEGIKRPPATRLRQKACLVVLGVFLFLILLEAGLRAGGFVFLFMRDYRNLFSVKQKGEFRILCLGESTTAFGGDNSYPSQLERILNARNIGVTFRVINKGIPATTTYLLENVERHLDEYRPDMVISMMGINDLCKHLPYEYPKVSKASLFLRTLRIYKLARLIWLHVETKIKEFGFGQSKKDKQALLQRGYSGPLGIPVASAAPVQDADEDDFEGPCIATAASDCIERGNEYLNNGKYALAKKCFMEAIRLEPHNDKAFTDLAWLYIVEGVYFEHAEKAAEAALKINPRSATAYLRLALVHIALGDYGSAEMNLKKSIEFDPSQFWSRIELGNIYRAKKEYVQAEDEYRQAVLIEPGNSRAYFELGWNYAKQKKYLQAEENFMKVLELNPDTTDANAALVILYEEMGRRKDARMRFEKATRVRLDFYNPVTRHNYLRLKKILDERGIQLVCVQYPMLSVEAIRRIFADHKNVIFVENVENFRKAISQSSYDRYFVDNFAGEFGHCTPLGNKLLAENIGRVIIKDYFHK